MALNGAYEHPKTRRLARTLGVDPWAALGLMEAVWAWVRKAARDGRIDGDQWEDLADYLRWRQPASELAALLVEAKFVDAMDGWWWIHDWDQHADDTTRKALDRSGKGFANGSPSRQWRKGESLKSEESSPTDHRNIEKVRVTARARPVPEPEPVPEPKEAAATRACEATAPPPLRDPDLAQLGKLLRACMSPGTIAPDTAIVRQVAEAIDGYSLDDVAAVLQDYRRRGRRPPNTYGFWPLFLRDALRNRGDYATEAAEVPLLPPTCHSCGGAGVVGAPDVQNLGQVRAAIAAGKRLCGCQIGDGWSEMLDCAASGLVIERITAHA